MIEELSNIVREVGSLLMGWRDSGIFEGKWEGSQFKAKADRMAHDELEKRLKELTPIIPIVSEEDLESLKEERPEQYWLVDPIDGTASFVNGFSGFVTQAALMEKNRPIYAAVFAPARNELYIAEKGKGAFLNGKGIKLNKRQTLETMIDNYPEPRGVAREIYNSFGFKEYVECGSISLKICKVADGTADLFIKDVIVRDWDLAAPHLILEEAGGIMSDISGNNFEYTGTYEHMGLVATHNEKSKIKIVQWYLKHKNGEN